MISLNLRDLDVIPAKEGFKLICGYADEEYGFYTLYEGGEKECKNALLLIAQSFSRGESVVFMDFLLAGMKRD